ncbi:MAG: hypothetical protein KTR31_11545 [Myxococcales bacterium]|nr:hypothetical protein [Myxococcales bacterium]
MTTHFLRVLRLGVLAGSLVGLLLVPSGASALLAALLAGSVVATSRPARQAESPWLKRLFHDIASSTDEDAIAVTAALAELRARANRGGPSVWSDPCPSPAPPSSA